MDKTNEIYEMSTTELMSLIGKPIYAIRNFHKDTNTWNFYISNLKITNIILSQDGIWFDTGLEIFNESELGNRFSLDKEQIKKTLETVKSQPLNNISEIFKISVMKSPISFPIRSLMLT